jgi:hypothetical protein
MIRQIISAAFVVTSPEETARTGGGGYGDQYH